MRLHNPEVGSPTEFDGRTCILTRVGVPGHAVYGPYQHLDPGDYVVEFNLRAAEAVGAERDDHCATVDVAADAGNHILAQEQVGSSRLRSGPVCVRLAFHVAAARRLEFRVATTGAVPLLIEEHRRVLKLGDPQASPETLLEETRFPDREGQPRPAFFLENLRELRRLYEDGATVRIVGDDVVVGIDGIRFYGRVHDDLRFVGEIFSHSAYNFSTDRDCCVIDIGMNIGLAALAFARKEFVKEVHSFELLKRTYDRARANLDLNPELARKVSAHNFGLAGRDEETTILVEDYSDSGMISERGSGKGDPEPITIRNAATVLGPIIEAARSKGRDVVAKVDCEGSEFAIFEVLEEHGLLKDVAAFMVEWHAVIDGKSDAHLIRPLLRHGFTVFNLGARTGNGFFYAVKGREPARPVPPWRSLARWLPGSTNHRQGSIAPPPAAPGGSPVT